MKRVALFLGFGVFAATAHSLSDSSERTVKLNGPFPAFTNLRNYKISPDGSWAVYRADGHAVNVLELYSVPTDGSAPPVRLNPAFADVADIGGFKISPDSTRVVYVADQDQDEVWEIYTVPIGGGGAIKLNFPMAQGGDVGVIAGAYESYFDFSPDSRRVVYVADQQVAQRHELFSASARGFGNPVKLNGPIPTGEIEPVFEISPDSAFVVYRVQESEPRRELFSVPINGSAPATAISGSPNHGGDVHDFTISPDALHVVYVAEHEAAGVWELYRAPAQGGEIPLKLSGPMGGPFQDVLNEDPRISPDSAYVVYRSDERVDQVVELFAVEIDGSNHRRLNTDPPVGGAVLSFDIVPDSSGVVFGGDLLQDEVEELFHAPLGTVGSQVRISGQMVALGDVRSWQITPDSTHVVYNADAENNTWWRMYAVPVAGGAVQRINQALPFPGDVQPDFLISPDSSFVVYRADREVDETFDLSAALLDPQGLGPRSVKLHPDLTAEQFVFDYQFFAGGGRLAFRGPLENPGNWELFATDVVPRATDLSPGTGPSRGGNVVMLRGCGFTPQVEVMIDGRSANFTYVDATELRVTLPATRILAPPVTGPPAGGLRRAGILGRAVDVEVSVAGIGSVLEGGYTYLPGSRR